MRVLWLFAITTLGLAILNSQSAWARKTQNSSAPSNQELQQRLEDLEQKYKILERNTELKEEQAKETAKTKAIVKVSTEGASISSADGNNEIRFRGLIQADSRFYLKRDGFGPVDTFILRRVRPYIEGKFAKRFEFLIRPDFGEGKVQLVDAYIDSIIYPEIKIRVGKYREPLGLERLEQSSFLHFIERGLPNNLVPNRDLGVMAHGEFLGGVFSYQFGIFNGIFDGGSDDFDINNAKDFAGRVFAHPFKNTSVQPAQGLGLGISGTYGDQTGSVKNPFLPAYKSAGQRTFFSFRNDTLPTGTAFATGIHWRISPQLYYYYKGFGFLGEYVASNYNVALEANSANLLNHAWQVQTNYVIGADNSYGRIKPRNPLGWRKGGTGAFEFGARYNELHVDPDAFPTFADANVSAQRARSWGVGFNWHVNDNVKFMLSFDQTFFKGGGPNGSNQKTENALLNRVQFFF